MVPGRLRLRFVVAAGLLVITTVTASVWTFLALTRLSGVVTYTVRQSESTTAVTSRLAGALEREDDAVLLVLAGYERGKHVLAGERAVVDKALLDLFDLLGPNDKRELADPLHAELRDYRSTADGVLAVASERQALVEYHGRANPLLRRVVALTTAIRDRHFELARQAVTAASNEARAARSAVLLITIAALGIAAAVSWHLTSTVVGPLRRLTRGADAIREGRFGDRIEVSSRDELGELASAFNQMSEDLAEFRRTNMSEVLRAKNILEATLEALPDAVVLFDPDCWIVSMNRAAAHLFEAAGIQAPATLDDLTLEGLDRRAVAAAVAAGADVAAAIDLTRTIRIESGDTVRRLLPRVVPVSGATAEQAGAILLLSDVTDLAQLDEMRSELVAVASHELQTPLTTLRMTLLMLQEVSDALPERHRELVTTSLIGVEQLTETVHEFLDLTRIEAGELRLDVEPLDVSLLLADALRRAERQAQSQGIRLRSLVDTTLPSVRGDVVRLRAVFENILGNALKYTPRGGSVTVETRRRATRGPRTPETVVVSITDTGPGVPDAFQSRIFDKFVRLEQHSGARSRPAGVGIGLYVCREIVKLHAGEISCAPGPGRQGTCITVELPAGDLNVAALAATNLGARIGV
jgi:NtrC-family two-component system sensor histidine kinase KinB